MKDSRFSWTRFFESPIVGIVRGMTSLQLVKIAETYYRAGLTTLEITMNSDGAADMIYSIRRKFPELNIGAGTVCNTKDLEVALQAGSQFIVTPIMDIKVIQTCVDLAIPIFPGAYTPTEIYQAWNAGASAVKIFPATQLGDTYIKDVLAPLNHIKLLPTGGVDSKNLHSFFEAGAAGVGMGSSLFDKELILNNDFKGLESHFKRIKSRLPGLNG